MGPTIRGIEFQPQDAGVLRNPGHRDGAELGACCQPRWELTECEQTTKSQSLSRRDFTFVKKRGGYINWGARGGCVILEIAVSRLGGGWADQCASRARPPEETHGPAFPWGPDAVAQVCQPRADTARSPHVVGVGRSSKCPPQTFCCLLQ